MAEPARKLPKKATYEDLLEVSDHFIAEIIDGELIVSPRPAAPHADAASALAADLRVQFGKKRAGADRPGGWWILYEPELHLADDILVPDMAGWTRERLPRVPNVKFFTLAPDWVCEVISPSNAHVDRVRKRPIYAREGVSWLWIVDPGVKTLEVFRLEGPHWLLLTSYHGDVRVRATPFEALELDLGELWLETGDESGAEEG